MVSEFAFVNAPVPLDVHIILLWLVALAPAVIFTAPELEQVNTDVPAIAVGRALILKAGDAPAPVVPIKAGLLELKAILYPPPVVLELGIVTVRVIPDVTPPSLVA